MFQLSVIVPVFNEEATVLVTLEKLLKSPELHQVVIVDDGSTDHTNDLVKKFLLKFQKNQHRNKNLSVIFVRQENQGKGGAIRTGLKRVTGNYVLIQDADCEYDPDEIPNLSLPIKKGQVQVVFGSRFAGPHLNLLFWNRVANSALNFLVNILFNTTLSDMETCYKLVPTQLMKEIHLRSNGFDIEPEITCKILKRGVRVFEVPISYVGRDFSQGKKITWQDGFGAFYTILKEKIFP